MEVFAAEVGPKETKTNFGQDAVSILPYPRFVFGPAGIKFPRTNLFYEVLQDSVILSKLSDIGTSFALHGLVFMFFAHVASQLTRTVKFYATNLAFKSLGSEPDCDLDGRLRQCRRCTGSFQIALTTTLRPL